MHMKRTISRMAALGMACAVWLCSPPTAISAAPAEKSVTVTTGMSAGSLADSLMLRPLEPVSGTAAMTYSDSSQIGIFRDRDGLTGLSDGVMLSTGDAALNFTPGKRSSKGFPLSQNHPDADLTRLNGGASTKDTVTLSFELIATGELLNFQYVFASSEFDQEEPYNDVFGLFIDGENIALLPDGSPVTIQNLKASNRYTSDPAFEKSGFNGVSTVLTCSKAVTPGQRVQVKIALGDVIDNSYDSAVLVKAGCLNFEPSRSVLDFEAETLINLDPACAYRVQTDTAAYTITAGTRGDIPLSGLDDSGTAYRFFGQNLLIGKVEDASSPRLIAVCEKPTAPPAPVGPSSYPGGTPPDIAITNGVLTVRAVPGQVYSLDGDSWITPSGNPPTVVFTGLSPGHAYTLRTRVPATSTSFASEPSEPLSFHLLEMFAGDEFVVSPDNGPYDGQDHTIRLQAPADVRITYAAKPDGPFSETPPVFRNAGEYPVYYRAEREGWYPYYGQTVLAISRAVLTVLPLSDQQKMTGQTDPVLQFTTDGAAPGETPAFTGSLSREGGETAGRYPITGGTLSLTDGAGFRADNYTLQVQEGRFFVIQTASAGLEDVTLGPGASVSVRENPAVWNKEDIRLTPAGEYSLISSDGIVWDTDLTLSSEGRNQMAVFRLQKPDGTTSAPVTVYYNLDREAPAGIRASYEPNRFFQFLHAVTFGLFFQDTVTVTLTAEDALSGVREFRYQLSDGRSGTTAASFRIDPQFKGYFTVTAVDEAGNASDAFPFEAFAVDSETPDVPRLSMGGYTPGQWTNAGVTITAAGASALSGIRCYQFRVGDGPWQDMPACETSPATATDPSSVLSAAVTISAPGRHTCTFRAVSHTGQPGPATAPVVIAVDTAPLSVQVSSGGYDGGWTKDDVIFSLSCDTDALSPVTFQVSADDGQNWRSLPGNVYEVTQDTSGTFRFRAISAAGNTSEASAPFAVRVQKTLPPAPVLTVSPESPDGQNGWYRTVPSITVAPPADHPAPVIAYYRLNTAPAVPVAQPTNIAIPEDGEYTLCVWTEDAAGNVSPSQTRDIRLDTEAPDGDLLLDGRSIVCTDSSLSYDIFLKRSADISVSGCDDRGPVSISWQFVNGAGSPAADGWIPGDAPALTPNRKGVLYARILDAAGNETVLRSRGIVLYTDAVLTTDTASFSPNPASPGFQDIRLPLELKGNTLSGIRLGDTLLTPGAEYTADEHGVVLMKEQLASVTDWPAVLTLEIRPQGEPFVDTPGNQAPEPLVFSIRKQSDAAGPHILEVSGDKTVYLLGDEAEPLRVLAESPDGGELSYQWFRDGQAIEGAASSSWRPDTSIPGNAVYSVLVTNTNTAVDGISAASCRSSDMTVIVQAIDLDLSPTDSSLPAVLAVPPVREWGPQILDDRDRLSLEQGGRLTISLSPAVSGLSDTEKTAAEHAIRPGEVGGYWRLAMWKIGVDQDGQPYSSDVLTLPSPIRVTLAIPSDLYRNGRSFSILSLDGDSRHFYEDLDASDDTITVEIDTFGDFALVFRDPPTESPVTNAAAPLLCPLLAAGTALGALLLSRRGKKPGVFRKR